ncbi:MAG: hypothetical protein ABR555_06495 [Pyrinomonadaceae bacterium]
MATKKKSSTKKSRTTAKASKSKAIRPKSPASTAKVQLDPQTVHRFESHLREGLVASGAVMMADNKQTELKPDAKVEMDPGTAARLSETLRNGMVSSQAVMSTDSDQLDKMTGQVKNQGSGSKKKKKR